MNYRNTLVDALENAVDEAVNTDGYDNRILAFEDVKLHWSRLCNTNPFVQLPHRFAFKLQRVVCPEGDNNVLCKMRGAIEPGGSSVKVALPRK